MRIFVTAFLLAHITFLVGSVTYVLLDLIQRQVFFGLYRMFMYHEAFPFQYIGLASIIFGLVGAFWIKFFGKLRGFKRNLSILLAIFLTVLLSSIPGGMLWKIHDMVLGYFPQGQRFFDDLWWGVRQGVFVGPLIAVFSFPFNIIGIVYGFYALDLAAHISGKFKSSIKLPDNGTH